MNATAPNPWSFLLPACFAAAALALCAAASAQDDMLNQGEKTYEFPQPTVAVAVPGIDQAVPSSAETIGMRQARASAKIYHHHELAREGMSPAWFGIATALDTMAAAGDTQQILASDYFVPMIQSGTMNEDALRLVQMRIQASRTAINVIESRSVQFSGDTQAQLGTAMDEARSRRQLLESKMTAAQDSAPNVGPEARAEMADAYGRYSEAAARVQRLGSS